MARADGFVIERVEWAAEALFGFDAVTPEQLGELLEGHLDALPVRACSSARTMSGRCKTSPRPVRSVSGDFDFDLFRLGLFALGQMDL